MKFKQYIALSTDSDGYVALPPCYWVIRKNPRPTAREEAIAARIIEEANPRENITHGFPWGPEQQMVLQQLWVHPESGDAKWKDVPVKGAKNLYTNVPTEHGDLPVPNAIKEPGVVRGDFGERIKEMLGEGGDGDE